MPIHLEIINYIIQKKGFNSYLEIGVHKPEHNFDLVKCKFKIGVDPNGRANFTGTSDEFFENNLSEEQETQCGIIKRNIGLSICFDCIFIDGLHHSEQVKKDFENSLQCLNENGIILIHDTDPKTEEFASWPRNAPRRWNGDVYKFMWQLRGMNDIEYRTIREDANGLTIIKQRNGYINLSLNSEPNFQNFVKEKELLLNLCSRQEFEEWL